MATFSLVVDVALLHASWMEICNIDSAICNTMKLISVQDHSHLVIWLHSELSSLSQSMYVLLTWGGGRQLRATYPATLSEFPSAFKIFTCTFPSTDYQIIQGRIPEIIVCTDAMRKILFLLRRVKDKRPSPSLCPLSYMLFMKLSVHILTNPGSGYCITERAAYE